jgi:S1-C subfamily serine protease
MNRTLLIISLLLAVTGCVSRKEMADRTKIVASADRAITCHAGEDCNEKWQRAQQWVSTNTTSEVTAQTDTLIETAGPSGLFDDRLGFTVTQKLLKKNAEQQTAGAMPDTYEITLFTHCNNWFGCTPSSLDARADFATFVIGPPVAKPVLGVKVIPVTLEMAQKMEMPAAQGVAVTAIVPNSLADKAELSEGDIIMHYKGVLILTEGMLTELVANGKPGQRVPMDIIRGRAHQTVVIDFPAATSK